jgi:hypothetical protein
VGGKGKRPGGLWLNSHLQPPPFSRFRTGEGAGRAGAGPVGVPAGDLGHGDGRGVGEKEEGVEGYLLRCSPRSGTACGGGSTARSAGGGLQAMVAGWLGWRCGGAVRACWRGVGR